MKVSAQRGTVCLAQQLKAPIRVPGSSPSLMHLGDSRWVTKPRPSSGLHYQVNISDSRSIYQQVCVSGSNHIFPFPKMTQPPHHWVLLCSLLVNASALPPACSCRIPLSKASFFSLSLSQLTPGDLL